MWLLLDVWVQVRSDTGRLGESLAAGALGSSRVGGGSQLRGAEGDQGHSQVARLSPPTMALFWWSGSPAGVPGSPLTLRWLHIQLISGRGSNAESGTGCRRTQKRHPGRTWWDLRTPASTRLSKEDTVRHVCSPQSVPEGGRKLDPPLL